MITKPASVLWILTELFVEIHKGKIWAESEGAGKGSTFIMELPLLT